METAVAEEGQVAQQPTKNADRRRHHHPNQHNKPGGTKSHGHRLDDQYKEIQGLKATVKELDTQLNFVVEQVNEKLDEMETAREEMTKAATKAAMHRLEAIVSEERAASAEEETSSTAPGVWYKDKRVWGAAAGGLLVSGALAGVAIRHNRKKAEREPFPF